MVINMKYIKTRSANPQIDLAPKPSAWHFLTESRALLEFGMTSALMPVLMQAPSGDKHPVMVLPGFLATDSSTRPLRTFLRMKNYKPYGWGLGRNLGRDIIGGDQVLSDRLINKVISLYVKHNQKVTLIGWSLGGILARELARLIPDCVRQVITLGSPFNGPKGAAPVASRIFQLLNGDMSRQDPDAIKQLLVPPPVPCSAIFSRSDGIAHWQACRDEEEYAHQLSENIEVKGSHLGLGHNPQVIWIIANRLAQSEGNWTPFREKTVHKMLFPNPERMA